MDGVPLSKEGWSASFVGRRDDANAVLSALEAVPRAGGRLFVIAGEPGIGKTCFAAEVAAATARRGFRVLWGRSWPDTDSPAYWPWIEVLKRLYGEGDVVRRFDDVGARGRAIRSILGGEGGRPGAGSEPFATFDAVLRLLAAAADVAPRLVIIEDVHAADLPSLRLLQYVARSIRELDLVFVVTYREPEAVSRPEAARLIGEISREGCTLVQPGLSEDETTEMIRRSLGIEPSASVGAALRELAGGNPLFVRETLLAMIAEGRDPATEAAGPPLPIPPTLIAATRRRLAFLSEDCIRLLSVGAVFGADVDARCLLRVCGIPPVRASAALAEVARVGFLRPVEEAPGRYAFAYPLLREALYRDQPPSVRGARHAEIGRALEELHATRAGAHLDAIARHFARAARHGFDRRAAIDSCRRAAESAFTRLEWQSAEEHARAALELARNGADARTRAELTLGIAESMSRAGNPARARQPFLEAAEAARSLGDATLLARAALGYGEAADPHAPRRDATRVALLEQALQVLPPRDALRVRVLAALALAPHPLDEEARRFACASEALDLATRLGDPAALGRALEGRHHVLAGPDHAEERLAAATRMIVLASQAADRDLSSRGHSYRLVDLLELGDLRGVDAEIEECSRLAESSREPLQRSLALASRAMRAMLNGSFDEAEALVSAARGLAAGEDPEAGASRFALQLLTLRREQGRSGEVEPIVAELVERHPSQPLWQCALVAICSDLGREDEAKARLGRFAARGFTDLPRDSTWYANVYHLAEACISAADAARAEALHRVLLPYERRNLVIGRGLACAGPASRTLGRLALAASRTDAAVEQLERALRASERMEARALVTGVRLDLAESLLARDAPADRLRAAGLLEEAIDAARRIGMTRAAERARELEGRLRAKGRPPSAATRATGSSEFADVFRLDGGAWTLSFAGRSSRLRDAKGLHAIAFLLRHPGTDFPGFLVEAGDGELHAAMRRACDRLGDLRGEIENAEAMNDPGPAQRARSEVEATAAALARRLRLEGAGGRSAEQVRVNLTKTIRAALKRIAAVNPALGAYLAATLRTGRLFSYRPDPRAPIRWTCD